MKGHPTWEEWSAWVDGECARPDDLRNHLAGCDTCAKQVSALRLMTTELHALPLPEVHPAFVTRVMARVGESAVQQCVPWWRVWMAPMASMAAVLLVIAGSGLWHLGSSHPSAGESGLPERLANAIADCTEAVPDTDIWELAMVEDVSTEELTEGIAHATWGDSEVTTAAEDDEWDELIASMNEREIAAFHGLVREYAQENEVI